MFRPYSDHLQGTHMFLVKVTDFKIYLKTVKTVKFAGLSVLKLMQGPKFPRIELSTLHL